MVTSTVNGACGLTYLCVPQTSNTRTPFTIVCTTLPMLEDPSPQLMLTLKFAALLKRFASVKVATTPVHDCLRGTVNVLPVATSGAPAIDALLLVSALPPSLSATVTPSG